MLSMKDLTYLKRCSGQSSGYESSWLEHEVTARLWVSHCEPVHKLRATWWTPSQATCQSETCQSQVPFVSSCYCCRKSNHTPSTCQLKESLCHYCGKKGHMRSVCWSKKQGLPPQNSSQSVSQRTHYLDTEATSGSPPEEELYLFCPWNPFNEVQPNQVLSGRWWCIMEVDTGVEVSVISEYRYKLHFPHFALSKSRLCWRPIQIR